MLHTDKFPLKGFNVISFVVIFELFFLLILYKVFNVQVTHDEVFTAVHYPGYTYWQIMMYPDNWPNNHILNTVLAKFLISVFGLKQWVLRLPNLLSFLVYAFAIFRINRKVLTTSSVFFIPASILFICNPYLLDFFGLSRGYGMSCALCMLSVSYLISAFMELRARDAWIAFFTAMLASYANFTLLVLLAAATAFVWLFFFIAYKKKNAGLLKPTITLALFCIGYALLIARPIIKMQSANMFAPWKTTGFYKDTIVQTATDMLYGSSHVSPAFNHAVAVFWIIAVLGTVGYTLWSFYRSGFDLDTLRQPFVIAAGVTLITALVSITQCAVLHTPNLIGRTALFFFPLFTVTLVTTVGALVSHKARIAGYAASLAVSVLLLFHMADTMSLKFVREWWYDSHTLEIADYLTKVNGDRKVTLKSNWLFHPSFYYYKSEGRFPNIVLKDYDQRIDSTTDAEYYYILTEDFRVLESKFDPVYELDNRFLLVRRKQVVQ